MLLLTISHSPSLPPAKINCQQVFMIVVGWTTYLSYNSPAQGNMMGILASVAYLFSFDWHAVSQFTYDYKCDDSNFQWIILMTFCISPFPFLSLSSTFNCPFDQQRYNSQSVGYCLKFKTLDSTFYYIFFVLIRLLSDRKYSLFVEDSKTISVNVMIRF